jgi:methionyl-tRNA formyltransferase
MRVLIANSNPLHAVGIPDLSKQLGAEVVATPTELEEQTASNRYDYIFFLHWSHIIPASIYEKHECVLFHMTDLPYGRGGSPLQNLIVRGHTNTKLTALRVSAGLDAGPIYLQQPLSLLGTAREIFLRVGELMFVMIREILSTRPEPQPQVGDPVYFKRRKADDGDIAGLSKLSETYDYIRMLDAEGYPAAFLETAHLRLEFSRASLHPEYLIADVRFTPK